MVNAGQHDFQLSGLYKEMPDLRQPLCRNDSYNPGSNDVATRA